MSFVFHLLELKCLFCVSVCVEFFAGSDSPYRESLDETLSQLSADEDRDVSYYATVKREQMMTSSSLSTESTTSPSPPETESAA